MNVEIRLSQAQRELLVKASDGSGMLSRWYVRQTTLDILVSYGYVVLDYVIRTEAERAELTKLLNTWVDKATAILNGEQYVSGVKWENALVCLNFAKDNKNSLAAKGYWITDAGREAVKS